MFTVIGERINTSREKVQQAVAERDVSYIQEDVKKQQAAGAHYIDVNSAVGSGLEMDNIKWLISIIQEAVTVPLCIDSPDPGILEMAYGMVKNPPLINSISLETSRFEVMSSFLKGKKCGITALCIDDTGMPKSADDIVDRAKRLVESLEGIGMRRESIYIDPLVQPVSTESKNALVVLTAVRKITQEITGVHIVCGLSNISFGLPKRRVINRTFLSLMMEAGLDAAIMDPLDHRLMAILKTTELLLGNDEYCVGYLKSVRAGEIFD